MDAPFPLAELQVIEDIAGDLVERDPGRALQREQSCENAGAIASTSPVRMASTSVTGSVMNLKSTSATPGFVPLQYGFAFSVAPWPGV